MWVNALSWKSAHREDWGTHANHNWLMPYFAFRALSFGQKPRLLGATCSPNRFPSQCEWSTRLVKGTNRICEDQDIFLYGSKELAYRVTTDWSEKSWSLYFEKLWQNPVFSRLFTRDGTRLPSECDYLQKNSSSWRLSMNNRHKRERSAVDFAANCHP